MAAMPNAKTIIKGVKFTMIALGVSLFKLKGVRAVSGLTATKGLYRAFVSRAPISLSTQVNKFPRLEE